MKILIETKIELKVNQNPKEKQTVYTNKSSILKM